MVSPGSQAAGGQMSTGGSVSGAIRDGPKGRRKHPNSSSLAARQGIEGS